MAETHPENNSSTSPEQAAEGQRAEQPKQPAQVSEQPTEAVQPPSPKPTPTAASAEGEPGTTVAAETTDFEAEAPQVPRHQPVIRGKLEKGGAATGTGRRKTSIARVRITQGAGSLSINGRSLDDYFSLERDRRLVEAPLKATDNFGKVDVWVRVNGGGTTGQTGAILLGIARALEAMDPSLHHVLHDGGFLTRDDRMVERKKYGYKKARKSFQFSKR